MTEYKFRFGSFGVNPGATRMYAFSFVTNTTNVQLPDHANCRCVLMPFEPADGFEFTPPAPPACECGVKFTGGLHSSWCPCA